MNDYDVAIVGGRVAGASTALLLARAGLRVAVLERSRVGSDTVSTHALMRAGVLQLSRWGVLPELVAAGTPAIRSTDLPLRGWRHHPRLATTQPGRRRPLRASPPPPRSGAHRSSRGLGGGRAPRDTGDRAAPRRRTGASCGVRVSGADGGEVPVRAGLTIGADGVGSFVAREVGARFVKPWPGGQRRPLSLRRRRPVGGLCLGIRRRSGCRPDPDERRRDVRVRGHHTRAYASTSARRAPTAPSTPCSTRSPAPVRRSCEPVAPRATCTVGEECPGYVRHSFGPGWALVGDAGYFRDPITTHGLTDALRDAELLSDAVLDGGVGASSEASPWRATRSTRDRLSKALSDVTESVCCVRLGRDQDPNTAARCERGDER